MSKVSTPDFYAISTYPFHIPPPACHHHPLPKYSSFNFSILWTAPRGEREGFQHSQKFFRNSISSEWYRIWVCEYVNTFNCVQICMNGTYMWCLYTYLHGTQVWVLYTGCFSVGQSCPRVLKHFLYNLNV